LQAGSKVEPHFQNQGNQPQQAVGTPSSGSTARTHSRSAAASPDTTSSENSSPAKATGTQAQ
jgi:hypothetical protein